MAKQTINIGTANGNNGDSLRTAFDKTNDNFDEIYTAGPVGSNIVISGNVISSNVTNANIELTPNGTGKVVSSNDFIPDSTNLRFLGSNTSRFKGAYIGTNGVYSNGPVRVPQYANATVRDATITTAETGMIILTGNTFQGYNGSSWVDLG